MALPGPPSDSRWPQTIGHKALSRCTRNGEEPFYESLTGIRQLTLPAHPCDPMRGDIVEEVLRATLFHWTYARHRIRHGIRHTAAVAGRGLRPRIANGRLRYMLISYAAADLMRTRLRGVEIAFGKAGQRLLIIERVVFQASEPGE